MANKRETRQPREYFVSNTRLHASGVCLSPKCCHFPSPFTTSYGSQHSHTHTLDFKSKKDQGGEPKERERKLKKKKSLG